MSQRIVRAGRGGRGRGGRGGQQGRGFYASPKIYKSPITDIEYDTFNTGASKHAALFTKSRKNIANFIQRDTMPESFLIAQVIRTGTAQTIDMPEAVDLADADAVIVRTEQ